MVVEALVGKWGWEVFRGCGWWTLGIELVVGVR